MTSLSKKYTAFKSDTSGSFALYFAIGVTTILMGVGCAFDMTQVSAQKSRIQDLADSTALAAAIAARNDKNNREQTAENYFEQNRNLSGQVVVNNNPSISFDDGAKDVTVEVSAVYNYTFMGMFGFQDPTITTSATAGYMVDDIAPLSISFAFDTSGSMGWLTSDGKVKMDVLQKATDDLFDELYAASERDDLLEEKMTTAFSSYNRNLVASSVMDSGHTHIVDAVDDMVAGGGTNSTPSLQFALNELDAADAAEADSRWAGYVVFMTDGDNNSTDAAGNTTTWDADSYAMCDQIKSAGYKVYTVAFEAPVKGQALLQYCASSASHYFDSTSAADLKNAFKLIGQRLGSSTILVKS